MKINVSICGKWECVNSGQWPGKEMQANFLEILCNFSRERIAKQETGKPRRHHQALFTEQYFLFFSLIVLQTIRGFFAIGQFAVGNFTVKKYVSFG